MSELQNAINNAALRLTENNTARQCASTGRPGMKRQVEKLIELLRCAMFPRIFTHEHESERYMSVVISSYLQQAASLLHEIISSLHNDVEESHTDEIIMSFISSIADISDCLETDIQAAYDGDPAATSREEIMLAYPAFEAISIYRPAHCLYKLGVPMLPRMMTEYAHRLTGIDIHPGAEIGAYFFIDHGTGVVIGETCTVGEHVKLYQGVTLGARSFELGADGNPVKGIKRHPDIGNGVVIYAGATILGGDTVIGDGCVVGGNVWLTHSLEAGTIVYNSGKNA